jgi:PAS domain S-box-containing protein
VSQEAQRFADHLLPHTRSEMALPLISRGQCVGALTVQSTREAAFSEQDVAVLQTMADQLAVAITNARLYEAAQLGIAQRAQAETRYRTLVHQAPIGVIRGDRAGNITHVNPAALEILGSPGEQATRKLNLLTLPNLVEVGIAAEIRRCMEEATPIKGEYQYISYWGQESTLSLHISPLRNEGQSVSGVLVILEDVTEQRRLERQLLQSAKLASIGELAAGVAHEINNPINGIINYAQLVLNQAQLDERQTGFVEGILREGSRVADIVRDLLTFARVEGEAHSLARVPDILQAALKLSGQQLKKDGVILEISEQPDLPQIKCRSQRIQQVFLNLLSNARHALDARYPGHDPNKQLEIRLEQVDMRGQSFVCVTFHDRGVGIPAQKLSQVFTPFFTTKRPDEGTGLGLAVSYGIVQNHRGSIQVESVEGEYTVFQVYLPVDPGWEV